jgi:glycosyl transferase family 25
MLIENATIDFNDINISTYIIYSNHNKERLNYIQSQFVGSNEFDVKIIKTRSHQNRNFEIWNCIKKITSMAIKSEEDVIIICEDDHMFTEGYEKKKLIENIIDAHEQGAALLIGGVSSFDHVIPVTKNRFWVNSFKSMQFLILYKSLFEKILGYKFKRNDSPEEVLSEMTGHKMIIYPFVSVKRSFNNLETINSNNFLIRDDFRNSSERIKRIQSALLRYRVVIQ